MLEQYKDNIKKLSDYAADPDNTKYNGLYMDYRAVVALLSPLKSFRNIPKYCSLSLLAEILELGNNEHSEGYTTNNLPIEKGDSVKQFPKIQQNINDFREKTKKNIKMMKM